MARIAGESSADRAHRRAEGFRQDLAKVEAETETKISEAMAKAGEAARARRAPKVATLTALADFWDLEAERLGYKAPDDAPESLFTPSN